MDYPLLYTDEIDVVHMTEINLLENVNHGQKNQLIRMFISDIL